MTQGYCTDKAELIGFLYDDCEPGERDRIARHVADCPDCTAELASLSATRRQLAEWVPPAFAKAATDKPWALGFQIDPAQTTATPRAAGPSRDALAADGTGRPPFAVVEGGRPDTASDVRAVAPWWKQPLPAWAQAAAALLIFAAGVGFGSGNAGSAGSPVD